jgi:hypothetical protein
MALCATHSDEKSVESLVDPKKGPELVEAAMGKLRPMPCLIWSVPLYGRVRIPSSEVTGERETVLDFFPGTLSFAGPEGGEMDGYRVAGIDVDKKMVAVTALAGLVFNGAAEFPLGAELYVSAGGSAILSPALVKTASVNGTIASFFRTPAMVATSGGRIPQCRLLRLSGDGPCLPSEASRVSSGRRSSEKRAGPIRNCGC